MEIKVSKVEDVTVVHLSGKIDFESIKNFRLLCARNWNQQRLLFDFEKLSFVGSSGITYLIESIENLVKAGNATLGFAQLKSEFRRIFEVGALKEVPVYDSVTSAARMMMLIDPTMSKPITATDPLKSAEVN